MLRLGPIPEKVDYDETQCRIPVRRKYDFGIMLPGPSHLSLGMNRRREECKVPISGIPRVWFPGQNSRDSTDISNFEWTGRPVLVLSMVSRSAD